MLNLKNKSFLVKIVKDQDVETAELPSPKLDTEKVIKNGVKAFIALYATSQAVNMVKDIVIIAAEAKLK